MYQQRADIYTRITAEIAAAIENGAGEWRMPWNHDGSSIARPRNVISDKGYRGINVLALWAGARRSGLEGDEAVNSLTAFLFESGSIHRASFTKGLSTFVLSTGYGIELKLACIRRAAANLRSGWLEPALSFTFDGIVGTPQPEFYEAVLHPFLDQPPPPEAQKKIVGTLISKYNDPRLYMWPILLGHNGQQRRDNCLLAVKRWLSMEYLDLFIRIIEETADDQFMPRKKFWLRYFEKGYVTDLTLVLATDAGRVARESQRASPDTKHMKWSNLTGANTNQSVLLMRLGDLVIAEWSHSGVLRFWHSDGKGVPEFHKSTYVGQELRRASMEVRVGDGLMRDAIRHDKKGAWTTWARHANRASHRHTSLTMFEVGAELSNAGYLLRIYEKQGRLFGTRREVQPDWDDAIGTLPALTAAVLDELKYQGHLEFIDSSTRLLNFENAASLGNDDASLLHLLPAFRYQIDLQSLGNLGSDSFRINYFTQLRGMSDFGCVRKSARS